MKKILLKNFEIKSGESSGEFSGYASVFNVVDSYQDVILPGAFYENLKANQSVKLLWQHNALEPIGTITKLEETVDGLYVEGKLLLNIARAREAYELLKASVLDSLSIGYEVENSFEASGIRYIKKVKLWEISLVTFPANQNAKILQVKSNESALLLQSLSDAIKVLR